MNTIFQENPLDFSGRTILVTGGGSGIGAVIALRFARAGADVFIHYRSSKTEADMTMEKAAEEGCPGLIRALRADLSRPEETEALFYEIQHRLSAPARTLDGIINNAAIQPVRPFAEIPDGEWEEMFNINLGSVVRGIRAGARIMAAKKGGLRSIVNIGSIEGDHPSIGHAHYAASKAAVTSLTKSAAIEYGSLGIRVNCLSPGLIRRPGIEDQWPDGVRRWEEKAPLKRLGTPGDVADACLFLTSPMARWITGVNLAVDGGMSSAPLF